MLFELRQYKERRKGSNDLCMHACCGSVRSGSERTSENLGSRVFFGRIFFVCLFKRQLI